MVVLRSALAVIAKCPRSRHVKTRLAAAAGEDFAREVALAMLADTLATVAFTRRGTDEGRARRARNSDPVPEEHVPMGVRVAGYEDCLCRVPTGCEGDHLPACRHRAVFPHSGVWLLWGLRRVREVGMLRATS